MKKIFIVVVLLTGMLQTFAQQDPQYSLYMFNPLVVNPAYAGSREVLSAVLVHRSQWIGLKGAPETQAFAINSPLKNKKMGVGLQLINDKIGPKNTLTISGTYAYRLKLGQGKLAFALRGGMISYNYDWNKIEYKEEGDVIPSTSTESFVVPTFDFGIYYNTRTFYAGIALEHLNESPFNLIENQDSIVSTAKLYSNGIGTIGKAFILNDNLILKTTLLMRASNTSGNLDINAGLLIKNKIYFGLSLRSSSALVLLTEINITKNWRMGIAYDWDGSELTSSTSGSVEFFIGYDLALFKSKVTSPRYF